MSGFVCRVPEGDGRERMICAESGHVARQTPRIVVGPVIVVGDAVLLCRRAIEPRQGCWTSPSGHPELGAALEAGRSRNPGRGPGAHDARRHFSRSSRSVGSTRYTSYAARYSCQMHRHPGSPRAPRAWRSHCSPGTRSRGTAGISLDTLGTVRLAQSSSRSFAVPAGNPPHDARGARRPGEMCMIHE
jgi:hypothetical protein